MAKIEIAVFDTGPLIHLQQVGALGVLSLFRKITISEQVRDELLPGFPLPKNCTVASMNGKSKDIAKTISERYDLGPGESSAIALAGQEGIRLFFTDDLGARGVAKNIGLEPHGTLAILTRAYREKTLGKKDAINFLGKLRTQSSLYLTSDLAEWTRKQIEMHDKQ
ncbi:MAG: hypothetical protein WCX64_05560 [Candidatus Micrarchaeia archaeon]